MHARNIFYRPSTWDFILLKKFESRTYQTFLYIKQRIRSVYMLISHLTDCACRVV